MLRSFSILCALGVLLAAPAAWANGSGDCDGDGEVTRADAEIARGLLNVTSNSDAFNAEADVDGDGVISMTDLASILSAAS